MPDEFVRKDLHDAEQDHILSLIAALDKRIDDIRDNVNRQFAVTNLVVAATGAILMIVQIGVALFLR